MIIVKDLHKSYGDVKAVDGINIHCEKGMITTLLGANGSGKTTVLRSLAGVIKPDSGSIHLGGIDVLDDTIAAQKKLGVFPDLFGLYPRLTTREHLEYFGELHGMSSSLIKERTEEIVEALAMGDIINRRTDGFSQGQRMKVALSRAMIHYPEILIFDEPTRGLDVFSVRLLRGMLRSLRDQGRCILMSCHVMAEVEDLSDQIIMIADGHNIAQGGAEEIIKSSGQENLEEAFVYFVTKFREEKATGEKNV